MGLLRSTATVGAMTLFSRVLGLLRDMVMARMFGSSVATDAFLVAFKIPNFLRRLFAEGAFSQAFVPVLTEYREQREVEEVRSLIRNVAGTLGLVLLVVSILAMLFAPAVTSVFATGFLLQYPDKFELTYELLRITFPYILFISLTALAAGVLNSYGRFAVPAFTPVLLNISLIAAALWWSPYFAEPITAMAWGVFIAGVAQLLFQLFYVARLGLLRWPRLNWRDTGVRRIGRLMLPGIIGSSAMQINLLFDVLIASFLVTGSVTWLYFADRMIELPLGVFGIALATVILPSLSSAHAQGNPQAFSRTLDWALRLAVVIALPAAVGLGVLATPIMSTLFQYGDFTGHDVQMAAWSLLAYSFGLLGFILVKILAPGYFARQDTRTPVKIGLIAMLVNMVCNVIFVLLLLQFDFEGPHAGLALATTISSFVNAMLLLRGLRGQQIYRPQPGWRRLLLQVVAATLVMGLALHLVASSASWWLAGSAGERVLQLAGLIPLGVLAYALVLYLSGVRPAQLSRPTRP
ncbi:MAG: murein biosynthesis integral membrane protein MurJ [Gammaproteobacteria bacterium]